MFVRRAISFLQRSSLVFPLVTSHSTVRPLSFPLSTLTYSTKSVVFTCGDERYTAQGKVGDSLLDVVINNDLPLDGFGACEGTLACCTCHVILRPGHFSQIDKVNPPGEEELDLLDLAPDLDDLSRLGCQIILSEKDDSPVEVLVPSHKRDARTV